MPSNNEILVVGSVAFDTVTTPYGYVKKALGGSATYFSLSSSYFTKTNLVAVVGNDFSNKYINILNHKNINLAGLKKTKGETFAWEGVYSKNMNERTTKKLSLNVFEKFNPIIPDVYKNSNFVFLANINPDIQKTVLSQMENYKFVACDTMDHWIQGKYKSLTSLISKIDILTINDSEIKLLARENNIIKAVKLILKKGPRIIIVKKGEHGSLIAAKNMLFYCPPYPTEKVNDPTGAGDSFAGGFFGYIARCGKINNKELKKAMLYGSVISSFCVEEFSVKGLLSISKNNIKKRFDRLSKLIKL